MAELRVEGLCKGWDFPVIDRLDLQVAEGEFFVVVGPSGIGKTTLLRLVAGLERCDAGRILVGGRDVTGLPPYRRNVAMTFESYALYPHLTVFENIASPLRARKLPRPEIESTVRQVTSMLRIDELLERRPGEILRRSEAAHRPCPHPGREAGGLSAGRTDQPPRRAHPPRAQAAVPQPGGAPPGGYPLRHPRLCRSAVAR